MFGRFVRWSSTGDSSRFGSCQAFLQACPKFEGSARERSQAQRLLGVFARLGQWSELSELFEACCQRSVVVPHWDKLLRLATLAGQRGVAEQIAAQKRKERGAYPALAVSWLVQMELRRGNIERARQLAEQAYQQPNGGSDDPAVVGAMLRVHASAGQAAAFVALVERHIDMLFSTGPGAKLVVDLTVRLGVHDRAVQWFAAQCDKCDDSDDDHEARQRWNEAMQRLLDNYLTKPQRRPSPQLHQLVVEDSSGRFAADTKLMCELVFAGRDPAALQQVVDRYAAVLTRWLDTSSASMDSNDDNDDDDDDNGDDDIEKYEDEDNEERAQTFFSVMRMARRHAEETRWYGLVDNMCELIMEKGDLTARRRYLAPLCRFYERRRHYETLRSLHDRCARTELLASTGVAMVKALLYGGRDEDAWSLVTDETATEQDAQLRMGAYLSACLELQKPVEVVRRCVAWLSGRPVSSNVAALLTRCALLHGELALVGQIITSAESNDVGPALSALLGYLASAGRVAQLEQTIEAADAAAHLSSDELLRHRLTGHLAALRAVGDGSDADSAAKRASLNDAIVQLWEQHRHLPALAADVSALFADALRIVGRAGDIKTAVLLGGAPDPYLNAALRLAALPRRHPASFYTAVQMIEADVFSSPKTYPLLVPLINAVRAPHDLYIAELVATRLPDSLAHVALLTTVMARLRRAHDPRTALRLFTDVQSKLHLIDAALLREVLICAAYRGRDWQQRFVAKHRPYWQLDQLATDFLANQPCGSPRQPAILLNSDGRNYDWLIDRLDKNTSQARLVHAEPDIPDFIVVQ